MRLSHRHLYLTLTAFALLAVILLWRARAPELEFLSRPSPAGFRELVLTSKSSSLDPLLGLADTGAKPGTTLAGKNLCDNLFHDPAAPALGPDNAVVSIVEFFDYRCPYCKRLTEMLHQIHMDDPRVRIVYKEWPVLGERSILAARAALAAAGQGQYQAFHASLMGSRFLPSMGYVEGLATDLGLDVSQLQADMHSTRTTAALQRTSDLAKAFGFRGTPSLVVGRTVVQGAISEAELKSLVEIEKGSDPGSC
ncbi:MAG: DsbA family protein [Rhodospirillaceae bacterium]|jgi:protein-disulfide isomerase|nr:DsbA family protein [Rhodospirillaceae bacterium]MBT4686599.1 DsbA family protein [Rhodospirillaceae bacterium]MBT5081624.1 DsbA family protein [Rhodospirillaceae bacterium]MBT5524860.1 DsbA family protein [Rhodospirillaceae bacterium]MBT5881099.1 DsbA family protein [Rhodospirillaceae bacterium]